MSERKLIFTHLNLDALWDQEQILSKVYSVRAPASVRLTRAVEDLGIFAGEAQDLTLCYSNMEPALRNFWELRGWQAPQTLAIHQHPMDSDLWLSEVKQHLPHQIFNHFIFAGLTNNEMQLLKEYGPLEHSTSFTPSLFAQLNHKKFLYEWAKSQKVHFPESQLVDLNSWQPHIKTNEHWLLKAPYGSGGGGGILLPGSGEALLKFMKKLNLHFNSPWLIQKYYQRTQDWTCFGEINQDHSISSPRVWSVLYDENRLSYYHRPSMGPTSQATRDLIAETYYKMATHLQKMHFYGPFGFDAFTTVDQQLFTIVDLNARLTKTHLLEKALQKVGIETTHPQHPVEICRWRFKKCPAVSFESFWPPFLNQFKLNSRGENQHNFVVVPLQWTCMAVTENGEPEYGPREVTFMFAAPDLDAPDFLEFKQNIFLYLKGYEYERSPLA